MPQSLSPPSTPTFFILALTLLFCAWSSPFALAQKFRPTHDVNKCSAFVEGQAFYLLGGIKQENFILDLSVPWNTSDPVYKKLEGGPPKVDQRSCAMTNNGEDLFVMSAGTGYIYNVKSNSWKPFPNPNFAADTDSGSDYFAVTDPETGIIYLPNGGTDFTGKALMLSVDIKTGTVNTSGSNPYAKSQPLWNTYLKSMVVSGHQDGPMIFTPSKVTKSSDGWSLLNPTSEDAWGWDCGASVHGGLKMIMISGTDLYILDMVKQSRKKGPPPTIPTVPSIQDSTQSCAVSGDQFIVWGALTFVNSTPIYNLIFNIKTEKWVSRYTPPPPRPTTTNLPPSQPEPDDTSSSDKKLVVIIVAVTGTLLAIILGLIFRFYRRTRQLDLNRPSTGSLDIKDSVKIPKLGLVGRLHEGVFGANQVPEHPHAIVEDPTAKRNLQEGAHEIQILPQHPHTMVGRQEPVFQTTPQHPHTMISKQELALQMPPQHLHTMVSKQELALQIPPQHPHAISKQELDDQ
ncbi:MAG: hypothetical protein J3Q66DRAFT_353066 [Benniella sp.]|nr:MAG: hypothetical protein J3Q66DRAFT_353066 [Benniella sp.]